MFLQKIRRLFQRSSSDRLLDFSSLFAKFQQILQGNNTVLELMAQMEDKLSGEYVFDMNYIRSSSERMSEAVYKVIYALNILSNNSHSQLFTRYEAIRSAISETVDGKRNPAAGDLTVASDKISNDMEELVGGKSARLGEIRNRLDLRTPEGFVITTAAYHLFMQSNDLWPKIRGILEKRRLQGISLAEASLLIRNFFDEADVPARLGREINEATSALAKRLGRRPTFAVRSSAWGEDDEIRSFAGQFRTVLGQTETSLTAAYKEVLASRFSESVLAYSDEEETLQHALPMAVACQEMIPAAVSGILYTIDPTGSSWDKCMITAVFGLGEPAVSGTTDMDHYSVSRMHPWEVSERRIGLKETRLTLGGEGEAIRETVPERDRAAPCLSDAQILELAQAAMTLERYFRQPQDIEWAIDGTGTLVILQSRPLFLQKEAAERTVDVRQALTRYPVLISSQGQIAQRGVAAGKVVTVLEDDLLEDFPQGAIAVAHYTTPRLTKIIRKTGAIVTDVGSPTGHMATVAREFGVPAIVGTGKATTFLKSGMEVTVDAEENKVYEGIVPELLEYEMEGRDQFTRLPEFKLLRKVLRKVTPLNLTDPASRGFTAANCQTYHDIVRYCHEVAVSELIDLHASKHRFRDLTSRKLNLPIPIGLRVIDTGGGLTPDAAADEITSIDQVISVPMRAILRGLTARGAWSTEPRSLDFKDFMSSLTRFSLGAPQPQYMGQNLAVISDHYTNLSLRLGYHFNVVDTYVSESINDNYVYFRFVGGVTEPERRYRRGKLIQNILERHDFKVALKGDLVVARLKERSGREMRDTLEMLGRLIGFTRQLDTAMTSSESVTRYADAFFEETSTDST